MESQDDKSDDAHVAAMIDQLRQLKGGSPPVQRDIETGELARRLLNPDPRTPPGEFWQRLGESFRVQLTQSGVGKLQVDRAQRCAQASYRSDRARSLRIRIYNSKWDRVALLGIGLSGLAIAAMVGLAGGKPSAVAQTAMFTGLAIFLVIQSGRQGYLHREGWNHIDDVAASLPATIIRGHYSVYAAECDLVDRAIRARSQRLMVVDVWTTRRRDARAKEFRDLHQRIDLYANAAPGEHQLDVNLVATRETWCDYRDLLTRRAGVASQRVFLSSPFQCDALLSDDEVILTFPRQHSDRSFAVRFSSRATVDEFWDAFTSAASPNDERIPYVDVFGAGDLAAVDAAFAPLSLSTTHGDRSA